MLTHLPGDYNARKTSPRRWRSQTSAESIAVSLPALCSYVGPPGRFEHIDLGQPFEVIVDYAHTPDALGQLLRGIRAGMRPGARLIVVFGLGGAPGTTMKDMGRLAARLSDRLILTTSGFRSQPPVVALGSLLAGARESGSGQLEVILDRRQAIERGVRQAGADDVVVIPGRGALPDMRADPRGEPVPFDDRTGRPRADPGCGPQREASAVIPQSVTDTPRRLSTGRASEHRLTPSRRHATRPGSRRPVDRTACPVAA